MAKINPDPDAVLTIEEHTERLDAGWHWLEANEHVNRREAEPRFQLWLRWVKEYQNAYTAIQRGAVPHTQEAFP